MNRKAIPLMGGKIEIEGWKRPGVEIEEQGSPKNGHPWPLP